MYYTSMLMLFNRKFRGRTCIVVALIGTNLDVVISLGLAAMEAFGWMLRS